MSIADKGGIQMSSFNKTVDGQDIEGFIIRAPRVTTNCIHNETPQEAPGFSQGRNAVLSIPNRTLY